MQKLASKNFLVFNLVLAGILFGSSLAFISFSCSSAQARAQERAPVTIPQDSLVVAEALQTVFRSVAEKVLPSIVEVQTISVQTSGANSANGIPWEYFFNPPQAEPNSQGQEYRSTGLGSGIIVRQNRDTYYVLTNYHVVEAVDEITVVSYNGLEYEANIVGTDERKDLALVSFKTGDYYPVAVLGDSDTVRVGDIVIALGNPLGYMFSVTQGIVSALGRQGGPGGTISDFIQTDASINQGNSGGALVNIQGEVIGINAWIASDSGSGSIGLGFAIPINNAKRAIDDLIEDGSITYGWLGVSLLDPAKEIAQALGVEGRKGSLAVNVFQNSPAYKGGIRPGDYITHLNGREMSGSSAMTLAVGDLVAGEQAVFSLIRDGASQDVTVRIEARSDAVAADSSKLWPGVYAAPLTDALRSSLNIDRNAQGVVAAQVSANSPAAAMGLQMGDLITAVNGEKLRDLRTFYRLLREKATTELWFEVIRGGRTLETMRYKL
jgi:Do/DeqQ family serine protease